MPLRAAGWWITVFSISFHLAMIDRFTGRQTLSITASEKGSALEKQRQLY
jgi:hypothetical protein